MDNKRSGQARYPSEPKVLVLLADLSAQPDQLRPFRRAQRFLARARLCLDPALFSADLSAEGAFED